MVSEPDTPGRLLLDLLGVRWSGSYENDIAEKAAKKAMENEPNLTEEWLRIQLYRYKDEGRGKDWRDYIDDDIRPRFKDVRTAGFDRRFRDEYERLKSDD